MLRDDPRFESQRGRERRLKHQAESIVRRAMEMEAEVISLGDLLFFSAESGDAWVLDPEHSLAHCLAIEGEPIPGAIIETPQGFTIHWSTSYEIRGGLMTFTDRRTGRVRTVMGYPTREIEDVASRMKRPELLH